jgi:hypothetical protein
MGEVVPEMADEPSSAWELNSAGIAGLTLTHLEILKKLSLKLLSASFTIKVSF